MRHAVLILTAALACGASAGLRAADVGLIKIKGAIGPATASYIARAIDVASERDDTCLIIELDTPGGSLDSTKEIVQKFYSSSVPTVVYVFPMGPGPAAPVASSRWPRTSRRCPPAPASARRTRFPSGPGARRRPAT